jgi:hypothetical protein
MLETISKISDILKASVLPLFLLATTHSTGIIMREEKQLSIDDAPGDNFPYIVMARGY